MSKEMYICPKAKGCPDNDCCVWARPHWKDASCDTPSIKGNCPACIPYIPEQPKKPATCNIPPDCVCVNTHPCAGPDSEGCQYLRKVESATCPADPKPEPAEGPTTEKKITEFNTLQKIVSQLEWCGYECEAGSLNNNVAFLALKRMAESKPAEMPLRANCMHHAVCKYSDDGMCPIECGHYAEWLDSPAELQPTEPEMPLIDTPLLPFISANQGFNLGKENQRDADMAWHKEQVQQVRRDAVKEFAEKVKELVIDGLITDGSHHKQWYLEQILIALGIDVDKLHEEYERDYDWERGIAP